MTARAWPARPGADGMHCRRRAIAIARPLAYWSTRESVVHIPLWLQKSGCRMRLPAVQQRMRNGGIVLSQRLYIHS